MAVDTKAKRMSMLGFGSPWSEFFEADGAVDADDRATMLHLYGGIPLDLLVELATPWPHGSATSRARSNVAFSRRYSNTATARLPIVRK